MKPLQIMQRTADFKINQQNDRTAQLGKDLKRSSGPTFEMQFFSSETKCPK